MAKSPIFAARHYRFIAQLLHELHLNDSDNYYIVEKFIDELKGDNSAFNQERFEHAVINGVKTNPRKPRLPRRPLGRALKYWGGVS